MKKKVIVFWFICLLIPVFVAAQQGVGISDAGFLTSLPPDAPSLNSPANETTQSPDSVIVIWYSQIHSATYTLQVSGTICFTDLLFSETVADTAYTLTILSAYSTYYWRVYATNVAGDGDISEIRQFTTSSSSVSSSKTSEIPTNFELLPVYPNPFNPRATITYHLPENADVKLMIYNIMGQPIKELVSGLLQAGKHEMTWDGRDNLGEPVTSGLYLCCLKTDNRVFTQKILLMR